MASAQSVAALFFVGTVLGIILAIRISRDRSPVARELMGLALAAAEWGLCYGLEFLSETLVYRQLWSQLAYLGIHATGAFMLRFAVSWIRPRSHGRWLHFVWIAPVIMVIGAFTNGFHGLVWPEIRPIDEASFIWYFGHGPLFWFGTVYQYLVIATSMILVAIAARERHGIYRQQAWYVIAGVATPIVANFLYLSRLLPAPVDITPMATSISVALLYIGVSRGRLLEVLPAASHRIMDLLPDGLLVVDKHFRIIDWNASALPMWGVDTADITGIPIADVVPAWKEAVEPGLLASESGAYRTELNISGESGGETFLGLEARPFSVGGRDSHGWIVMFRNETEIRRAERELQRANERLESLNKMLLSQAIHDSLTGLFNRAYLDEALPREMARCRRDSTSIALLILDVDYFKNINDNHGHDIGDGVLVEVARLLKGIVRAGDIPCRFGGDELVAVMPGATSEEALTIAQRVRRRVDEHDFGEKGESLHVSVSVGIASFPEHAESESDLFRAADRALYAAKDAGRNQALAADARS